LSEHRTSIQAFFRYAYYRYGVPEQGPARDVERQQGQHVDAARVPGRQEARGEPRAGGARPQYTRDRRTR